MSLGRAGGVKNVTVFILGVCTGETSVYIYYHYVQVALVQIPLTVYRYVYRWVSSPLQPFSRHGTPPDLRRTVDGRESYMSRVLEEINKAR